jgi:hypothetical protein
MVTYTKTWPLIRPDATRFRFGWNVRLKTWYKLYEEAFLGHKPQLTCSSKMRSSGATPVNTNPTVTKQKIRTIFCYTFVISSRRSLRQVLQKKGQKGTCVLKKTYTPRKENFRMIFHQRNRKKKAVFISLHKKHFLCLVWTCSILPLLKERSLDTIFLRNVRYVLTGWWRSTDVARRSRVCPRYQQEFFSMKFATFLALAFAALALVIAFVVGMSVLGTRC